MIAAPPPCPVGEQAVFARALWNDSGFDVTAGALVLIAAHGEWFDWNRKTGPGGYVEPKFDFIADWRRAPGANWFALVGCVDKDKRTCQAVQFGQHMRFAASGRLWLFANDLPFMYWNNSGAICVRIAAAPPVEATSQ